MAHRKEVFQSKVLQRLYPTAPKRGKEPSPSSIVETLGKTPCARTKALQNTLTGDEDTAPTAALSARRLYTVLPPPADYKAGAGASVTLPQPENINTAKNTAEESTPSGEEPDQDGDDIEHGRRRRKRRRKKVDSREHADTGGESQARGSITAPSCSGQAPAGEASNPLSRNRRRKLKKKRHKEKLLSMGLVPRAAALEFTYQREGEEEEEEDDNEEEEVEEEEGSSRASEISEFLRTSLELYMSDGSTPLRPLAVEILLNNISNGSVPPTVLKQLSNLKALVQLKESDRLANALKDFNSNSPMSSEETIAVISLFRYWMTDILPIQRDVKAGHSTTQPQD